MGRTTFICKIDSRKVLEQAIRSIKEHNDSPQEFSGQLYTNEEFAVGDSMRFNMMKHLPPGFYAGCMEKWTRGEDICHGGCFVKYQGSVWLEVSNGGGGLCTTLWLQRNHPTLNWIGSHGKPDGFYEAPMISYGGTWDELFHLYREI